MGLDTTHDCWSGPYSSFMRWRANLHHVISGARGEMTIRALEAAWAAGRYDDQSVPINVLMNHSDCDGEIAPEACAPLADALEALLTKMPPPAHPLDRLRHDTEQFIAGLRKAAAAGEAVGFH